MRLLAATAGLCLLLLGPARAADLAAHRALYRLTMDTTRAGDVVAASGTMGYEVEDACDGWTVRQRLEMTVTNHDGQDIQMVSDYATWEAKDGLSFRFHMKQTTDGAVTSETDGDARLETVGGTGEAHYATPKDSTEALPAGTLFPMAHTAAILSAAEAGKRFMAVPLFDGTTANGAQDSFITITKWSGPRDDKWPALSKLPSGRVHVAFFDRDTTAQMPDYEVGMRYWQNGVADDLSMDFGDFVMSGKLTEFRLLPHGC
jgi:opacity protein-like surface antigen